MSSFSVVNLFISSPQNDLRFISLKNDVISSILRKRLELSPGNRHHGAIGGGGGWTL